MERSILLFLLFLMPLFISIAQALQSHAVHSRAYNVRSQHSLTRLTGTVKSLDNVPNTYWFSTQLVDHFNVTNSANWSQRYFVNDTFFRGDGPVFLCVGGEGPGFEVDVVITGDVHCALMMTLAAQHNALVFALEHRYYGLSIPTSDLSTSNLRFLSSRQAQADAAFWHESMVVAYKLTDRNRWITFGGSYPGMMASFLRLKYPNLFYASVSSSAPVEAELNFVGYNNIVAASLGNEIVGGSTVCVQSIKAAFALIGAELGSLAGQQSLAQRFNVCTTLEPLDNQRWFLQQIAGIFAVQSNDPLCSTPLCNISSWCSAMTSPSQLETPSQQQSLSQLVAMSAVLNAGQCVIVDAAANLASLLDINATVYGTSSRTWTYQTCVEFGFYQTCDPDTDCPFTTEPHLINLEFFTAQCLLAFNITAEETNAAVDASNAYYGGNQPQSSRVLFVNGDIDPWHSLGVLTKLPDDPEPIVVKGASHHAWTHPARVGDSPQLIQARQEITVQVQQWLSEV